MAAHSFLSEKRDKVSKEIIKSLRHAIPLLDDRLK
jgi:hypothetical protein